MGNELLVKIQEKIGSILDLITFENTYQLVRYVAKYIALNYHMPVAIVMMIFSISGFIAILKVYKYEKEKNLNEGGEVCILTIISITATILFTIFALIEIYQVVMIIMFPEMAVINWLK